MSFVPGDYPNFDRAEMLFSRLKEEYTAQAIKNLQVLETLNFGENDLSENTKSCLQTCAECCQILGLNEINHANLVIKYSDLILQKAHSSELELKYNRNEHKMKNMLTEIQEQNSVLEREVESANKICLESEEEARKKLGKISFFKEKLKQYQTKLQELEESAASDSGVSFSMIIEDDERLKVLNEKIKTLKSKLNYHRKLPSNEKLAEEKLKQANLVLESLQADLNKVIENFVKTMK